MPISEIVIIVFATVGVAFLVVLQRKRMAAALAGSTEYTVGSLATRLGLQVVEGDPSLNFLYLMRPGGDNEYGEYERRVRLVGAPYGRQVELSFADGIQVPKDAYNLLIRRQAIHHYRCTLSVALSAPVPEFEVTLRAPNEHLRPRCTITGNPGAPDASLGNRPADALFRFAATDPRVGPAIASALAGLAHHLFVHVHAHDGRLEMFVTRNGLPYVAHAAEEYLLSLETIACALEGRAAPCRPVVALPRAA